MTSDDEWQVELSNGRAVYLKPAEHGAPQARASLMSLMMTLIPCLIRAEQGAPQTRDALRSHLASSHLASSHHTSPQLALTTVSPPHLLLLYTRSHSQTRLSFTPGGRWSIRAPTQPKKITFSARDSELAPHLISAIWRISDLERYRDGLNAPHVRVVTSDEMERVVAGAPTPFLLYVHH